MRRLSLILVFLLTACSSLTDFHGSDAELSEMLVGAWFVDETPSGLKGNKSAAQLGSKYILLNNGDSVVVSMNTHMPPTTYHGGWIVSDGVILFNQISDESPAFKNQEKLKVISISKNSFVATNLETKDELIFNREK